MSSWTYISGTVRVAPCAYGQHAKEFVLKEVLDHLPLVPGSEGPMTWHIIREHGYNSSTNYDEFGQRTNLNRYNHFSHIWKTQDYYIVVLEAQLRDTHYEETLKAFVKWLNRLSKRVSVYDMLVRVSGLKRDWQTWGERIFSGAGCWGEAHFMEMKKARRDEGLDVRRSTNWRYDLMPESSYWPDILVNLLPGGLLLAHEHDLILGNCVLEEYLEYDHKTGEYGDVRQNICRLLLEAEYQYTMNRAMLTMEGRSEHDETQASD